MVTIREPKFTGGDNFTGIYKLYHDIMMLNELSGGYGAYKISYAGGNSGLSFGGNQMDLSEEYEYSTKLVDILINAADKKGNNIFAEEEVKQIAGKLNANLREKRKSPETIFEQNLDRVNAALTSDYGRNKINEIYKTEQLPKNAARIEEAIQKMKNPAAKEFYDSDLGRVLLFDFHNQFKLNLDGKLLQSYIDGSFYNQKSTIYCERPKCESIVAPTNTYTLDNHKEFIRSTKQYYDEEQKHKADPKHGNDCERRLGNIEKVMAANAVAAEETQSEDILDGSFAFKWEPGNRKWLIFPETELPDFSKAWEYNNNSIHYILPCDFTFNPHTFYYDAATEKLYFVENSIIKGKPLAPGEYNHRDWTLLKVVKAFKSDKLCQENYVHTANLFTYGIWVKKTPISKETLLGFMENIQIEGALAVNSTHLPKETIPAFKKSIMIEDYPAHHKKFLFSEALAEKNIEFPKISHHPHKLLISDADNSNIDNEIVFEDYLTLINPASTQVPMVNFLASAHDIQKQLTDLFSAEHNPSLSINEIAINITEKTSHLPEILSSSFAAKPLTNNEIVQLKEFALLTLKESPLIGVQEFPTTAINIKDIITFEDNIFASLLDEAVSRSEPEIQFGIDSNLETTEVNIYFPKEQHALEMTLVNMIA